jgi:hypothetical protein
VEFGCQMISLLNVVAVAVLSLVLAGQATALGREVVVALLYSVCAATFAMLVRRLTLGIRGLGMATPLLVVVMLTVCPVFFDLGVVRQLQYCFPPTYFVNDAGVPLIAACACYAEEYFLQVDGKHHKVSDMLGQLLDLVASITIHADGNSDMLEILEKVYFMKNTHLFFAEYKRTHKAGYVVWTFNLDQYLPKQ